MTEEWNWAGNHRYATTGVRTPRTLDELREAMAGAEPIRLLGTRHSFNEIADSDGAQISLAGLPAGIRIDADDRVVTVGGGVRYGELAQALQAAGFALHNLASLPHISVAGAVATATHGSGIHNGNLGTAVRGLRILRPDGELVSLARGDADFDGAVVSLGLLGAVVEVDLDIEPTFDVRQTVFERLGWDAAVGRFDEVMGAAYSVSLFTTWDEDAVAQVWVKERVGDEPAHDGTAFFGATAAPGPRHMIAGMDPRNATAQQGVPGPWSERLAHFRPEFTPSGGEEIQSEYLMPRTVAADALTRVREIGPALRDVLYITEVRTVAADRLWLSTAYEGDAVALHFTWRRDPAAVEAALEPIEEALLPLGARPHWGKVFLDRDGVVPDRYARMSDFRSLVERYDPAGRLRNPFTRRVLGL